jgi:MacB-like periplasmic core domain/FtsX-like permease family
MQTTSRRTGEEAAHDVDFNPVSPEYFSLVRIPIVQGRTFTSDELEETPRAVIVTEATARRYWPGQDPIGRSIVLGSTDVPLQIVGIAKDAQVSNVAQTESSYIYLPAGSPAERGLTMLVRSRVDFDTLATGIRAVTQALDPTLVVRVAPLQENLDYWRAGSRVIASLSRSLGLLALILACGGVYGVVSYVVARRRREVGIRMALGATDRDVRSLILRQTLRPVAGGVLVGAIGAAAASRTLESVLFGVSPFDPVAFIGAPLFLFGAAALATLLPLRQAMKVDPISTLRSE